ncbi:MAG: FkbM family methyltransferase, partial [Acidimicrobiia bacterium]|nr:FkbM family methyltransferase [Acidimicrobiia bacterium]
MSRRYERLASAMVGTPLQAVAETVRDIKNVRTVRREPGLADVLAETRRTYELMSKVIRADTNCVDVGAHLGVMLHRMMTLAAHGQHHAFEPVPYKA